MHDYDIDVDPAQKKPATPNEEKASNPLAGFSGGRHDALNPNAILHLQRTAGNASVAGMLGGEQEENPVKDVLHGGGGRPLEPEVREFAESRLGGDYGNVKIHDDAKATESAQSVQAHAYTSGENVVFQSDQYRPDTDDGKKMLLHELSHVDQQRSGDVEGTSTGDGLKISNPSDRFEQAAESRAEQALAGGGGGGGGAEMAGAGASVQRDAEHDDVQGAFIQRDAAADEKEEPVAGSFIQRDAAADEKEDPVAGSFIQRQEEEGPEGEGEEPPDKGGDEEEGEEQIAGSFIQRQADEAAPTEDEQVV